jgi:ribonucleoside-diphosphate reductase alpha chain
MKVSQLKKLAEGEVNIAYQPASVDIWDKKYRLKTKDGTPIDKTIDDTYKRVARALADVELSPEKQKECYATARSRPGASRPMPVPGSTSRPPRRSTAPSPAPSRTR